MRKITALQMATILLTSAGANSHILEMMSGIPKHRSSKKPDPDRQSAAEAKRQRRIERNKKLEVTINE